MSRVKHTEPEVYKAKSKEILHSLESEYQWLDLLKDIGKPYESLISVIQREGRKDEDEIAPNLSIKNIADEIGEPGTKVTKWLTQIYSDLFDLNYDKPTLFNRPGTRYELHFKSNYNRQTSFFTLWLNTTLSVNDRFDWHFMNAQLGAYYFYITDISHTHEKGEFTTNVFLNAGFYNGYREMLLYKADFMNLISFDERFHLNDYQLDVLLRERVENGNDVEFETRKGKNYFKGNNW